jgi:hypothetical protein
MVQKLTRDLRHYYPTTQLIPNQPLREKQVLLSDLFTLKFHGFGILFSQQAAIEIEKESSRNDVIKRSLKLGHVSTSARPSATALSGSRVSGAL